MSHSPGITLPYLVMAVLSAILMGTIGVISKTTGLTAETVTFYRLGFGALLMLVYLLAVRQVSLLRRWPSWHVMLNGLFLASFILFYVQAMNYTSMANAIMMVYLAPVTASVVAHFFLKERLTLFSLFLISVALFGFAMMMEFKLDISGDSGEAIGIGYALLSLMAYAGFILVNRMVPDQVHVYTRTWYQLFVGALCMLPFMLTQDNIISGEQWMWLLAAGLFPGFLAILFAVVALQHLPASVFGTLAYFEPIAVVLFGWFIFGETLTLLQMSGCLLILASGITQGWTAANRHKKTGQEDPEIPVH